MLTITIDGPSGSGKSTIAKAISKKRNILYLDTGAMYRGVGYFASKNNVNVSDKEQVIAFLPQINMDIVYKNGEQKILINGEDVTPFIRENNVSMLASTVSKIPEVRLKLVEIQRKIALSADCVMDGRDIGSYVLPNASHKFFLTASDTVRAQRRHLELQAKGSNLTFDEILNDMRLRDEQDSKREFAPLIIPEGAKIIDTTSLTIQEVTDTILECLCK